MGRAVPTFPRFALGNGVQIEQPEAARKDARVRDGIARAVAAVYLRQKDL
jgi:hypothetical protein